MNYEQRVLEHVEKHNPHQKQFYQAAHEVLTSIAPVLEQDSSYERWGVLERMVEPDRQLIFRVPWVDDAGRVQVNTGFRVQFNNTVGPYKGGLRFHPSVTLDVVKFLGFEQTFKNALTGLPMGGGKGGADFDPHGKSDLEVMRFCQSFMTTLYKHIGSHHDIPAGDIGVGEREIGYLFGEYKRVTSHFENTLTGKGLDYGGSLGRTEATGYGLVYLAENALTSMGRTVRGLDVCISGSGNVAIYAAEKVQQLGGRVLTMSDSTSWIYDPDGIDLDAIKRIKLKNRQRINEYVKDHPHAVNTMGAGVWNVPCQLALPCATQNELTEQHARALLANKVLLVAEGANMPCTAEAVALLRENNVPYLPGKAANAGGVATSGLEMSQMAMRYSWSFEKVDERLRAIMGGIFQKISAAADEYGHPGDYMMGANIASFKKVAASMIAQGVC